MMGLEQPLESVKLAALLLGSLLGLGLLLRPPFRTGVRQALRHLHADENGAAYSIAYVFTVPIYVLIVCLIIEATLLLMAKIGTVSAAHAAARSQIVYRSFDAQQPGRAQARAELAARMALTPYASSSTLHARDTIGPDSAAQQGAAEYVQDFRQYAGGSVDAGYLRAKFLYAAKATRVEAVKPDKDAPNGDVVVTIRYYAPLHVPVIGRILGQRNPWGGKYYTHLITSTVRLPDDAPQTGNGQLGINYAAP